MLSSLLLLFFFLGAGVGIAVLVHEFLQLKRTFQTEQASWAQRTAAFEREIARLAKWENVADAAAKASAMLEEANALLAKATSEAEALRTTAQRDTTALLNAARTEADQSLRSAQQTLQKATTEAQAQREEAQRQADTILTQARTDATAQTTAARQDAKTMRDEARTNLEAAASKARDVIAAAHKRAEEIAGSAYEAMRKADLFAQTVTAMKNLIDGYGDQYLIPERSLLDDLADEFGHTEAGNMLKQAREHTKAMVRAGTAATCEYVEDLRRNTAINFVTDAFNGKVDSILSRVRNDNAGTLRQEIKDAYTLVNYNGRAFRFARISEEYLQARLEELRWAAVAQQLKLDEREEQRRIKEQLREEEKARREYERAVREAAKDEELLRKAMEKALQKVQEATEAQKAKYELQLEELTEKLRQAEERSQRALSMAQQTKRGHVYVISNIGSFGEHVYKIGLTRRLEPLDRVRELGDSSVPFEFDVHAMIFADDAPALEHQLHQHFVLAQMNKVNYRKEFFKANLAHIREEVEKLGLNAKWTMTAAAREHRETLAIEAAIKDNPAMRDAWINRQLELDILPELSEEEATAAV